MTINYVGKVGSGLGFQLAGVQAVECESGQDMLAAMARITETGGGIVFVDEALATEAMKQVEELNRRSDLTIVLLANSAQPQNLAAKKLNRLMVQAVGMQIGN